MRIKEARTLFNTRRRRLNVKNGVNIADGLKSGVDVGRLLWPDSKKSSLGPLVNGLEKGKVKGLTEDKLLIVCHEYLVDPNFIFNFPSVHDNDYIKLVEKNQ